MDWSPDGFAKRASSIRPTSVRFAELPEVTETMPVDEILTDDASLGILMPGATVSPSLVTRVPWSLIWKEPSRV